VVVDRQNRDSSFRLEHGQLDPLGVAVTVLAQHRLKIGLRQTTSMDVAFKDLSVAD